MTAEGITTKIIKSLEKGAVFIWCNSHLHYPKRLAADLGREDLEIVSPSWLERQAWRGRTFTDIRLDHATNLNDRQEDCYINAKSRIRSA